MASVTASVDVPGPISAAEALWYDLRRRPSILEGFGHLVQVKGDWPNTGSRVFWDGTRASGRGRVAEVVVAHEQRLGQTVTYEDEKLLGTLITAFAPADEGLVRLTITFEFKPKEASGLGAVVNALFVKRPMGDALRRTLQRFRIERLADLDDERAAT